MPMFVKNKNQEKSFDFKKGVLRRRAQNNLEVKICPFLVSGWTEFKPNVIFGQPLD